MAVANCVNFVTNFCVDVVFYSFLEADLWPFKRYWVAVCTDGGAEALADVCCNQGPASTCQNFTESSAIRLVWPGVQHAAGNKKPRMGGADMVAGVAGKRCGGLPADRRSPVGDAV